MNGLNKAYEAVYDLTAYIAAELENVLPDFVLDYLISEYPDACQAGVTYLMQDDNPGDGLVGMYQDVGGLQSMLIKGLCWHWASLWTDHAQVCMNELVKSQQDARLAEPHSARALTPFEVVTADLHKATPALEERATAAIQEQRRQQEQEFVEAVNKEEYTEVAEGLRSQATRIKDLAAAGLRTIEEQARAAHDAHHPDLHNLVIPELVTADLGESGCIQTAQEEPIQGMKDLDTLIHELAMCVPLEHQQQLTYELQDLVRVYSG